MKLQRLSVLDIVAMKRRGERIAALTAYDYTSAQMVDAAGVPFILIGDTLGMVVQGHDTTLPVTLDHIIYHAQMVERGTRRALLVGDLPFMTYQISLEYALRNAARLMKDGRRRRGDRTDCRAAGAGRYPGLRTPRLHAAIDARQGRSAHPGARSGSGGQVGRGCASTGASRRVRSRAGARGPRG